MANKNSQTRNAFVRHVAPLAPVALALLMHSAHKAPTHPVTPAPVTAPTALFTPICGLPFPGSRIADIDDHCGMQGGSSDPAKQAEGRAKNDFCAATGPSQPISYQELVALQTKASSVSVAHLADRSPLALLGEGKYVEYVALIQDAHYSDVSNGEAVNCNIPGNATNDIHIVLVQNASDDPCKSTTAEMSPHFRPAEWTPGNLNATRPHPVKIYGHLFYDGSHTPCTATSRPNPKRISLWEIHPAYKIEVCRLTDMVQCQKSANAADWLTFEDFLKNEGVTSPSTEQ